MQNESFNIWLCLSSYITLPLTVHSLLVKHQQRHPDMNNVISMLQEDRTPHLIAGMLKPATYFLLLMQTLEILLEKENNHKLSHFLSLPVFIYLTRQLACFFSITN